tara:strand:+ start:2305 stop:2547 length:243 start_codon:yes stop_codon:yes gene_type:complete
MNNEIKFKYYFKKNHKVYKNELSYLQLLGLLDMQNKTDNKGQLYKKGYTYQLQWMQQFLLNNKDLKIFKCNVYLQDQIIL